MKAVGYEPQKIRDDAKRMLQLIKDGPQTEEEVLAEGRSMRSVRSSHA